MQEVSDFSLILMIEWSRLSYYD